MSASALRVSNPEPVEPTPVVAAPAASIPVLDIDVAEKKLDFAQALKMVAEKHGKSYQQVLVELAKTAFGPGKLSFNDYLTFRLFDDAALAGADKAQFVGLDAARRIWLTANFDQDWWGVMQNKLAATTLLGGYGYPVIPTLALVSDCLDMRSAPLLRDAAALANFLRDPTHYPLFGKPMDSLRSLGSASFDRYDAATDVLVTPHGAHVAVEAFAAEVVQNYHAGYILQRRVSPHAAIRAVAGDRLATVRVLTIRDSQGARVHRAVWKIPAGSNVADNFWRGNLLATLDLENGRVVRAVRGTGLNQEIVERHPDSGAALVGFEIPCWDEVKALACAGAGMLGGIRLIGWDIAVTDAGAVIVEPNYTPDFDMLQMADRRGMLDQPFLAFLDECKAAARAAKRRLQQIRAEETRSRMRQLSQSLGF